MIINLNSVKEYISIDEEFSDNNREIKGICTDIVVNDFFQTKENLFNFLKLVYDKYTFEINNYINQKNLDEDDIIFTFKGGNILRLLAEEFNNELPYLAGNGISNFYQKYFKRSDADFSIYINPYLKEYDGIFVEISELTYKTQMNIRDIINDNKMKYLDFYKYNDEYKKNILDNYISDLNESSSVADPDNKLYYNSEFANISLTNNEPIRSDFFVKRGENNNFQEYDINSDNNTNLVISRNEALEFISGDGNITKFTLIRTKIYFYLTMIKNNKIKVIQRGGELIDVSIPHRKDKSIYTIFDNFSLSFKEYKINYENRAFTFISYSLDLLIEDLEKILFHVAKFPWDDNKYVKRLNRLCYLYYLEMFVDGISNYNKILIIKKTRKKLNKCYNTKVKYTAILRNFSRILRYKDEICNKIVDVDNADIHNEFDIFIDNININLDILESGINSINLFCLQGPTNIESNLYDTSIKNIL
tara:strand:- start:210 stop:1637 length:1428 start_codon:yes stop_codon:yes gene_type:complete